MSPVEVTTRFATTVDDLPSAWLFVMDRIDKVGDSPSIEISPVWIYTIDGKDSGCRFAVVVSGMLQEEADRTEIQ